MHGREDLDSFLDKWRGRWPEWRVAEAFLPRPRRGAAIAWLALRQELADAAWAGVDPRPGEAKLGWWLEELQGWQRGASRHPLGRLLQPLSAPWAALAQALPALAAARERPADFTEGRTTLAPFARVVAKASRVVAGAGDPDEVSPAAVAAMAVDLQAQRLVGGDVGAVPLQARARLGGDASDAALRAEAAAMLLRDGSPATFAARFDRIQHAILRARLRNAAVGAEPSLAIPPWRALPMAWRAARAPERSIPPA